MNDNTTLHDWRVVLPTPTRGSHYECRNCGAATNNPKDFQGVCIPNPEVIAKYAAEDASGARFEHERLQSVALRRLATWSAARTVYRTHLAEEATLLTTEVTERLKQGLQSAEDHLAVAASNLAAFDAKVKSTVTSDLVGSTVSL